jgi:hypothetical protein
MFGVQCSNSILLAPPTPAPLFPLFPPVQTQNSPNQPLTAELTSNTNQMPTDAGKKMKSTVDLDCESTTARRPASPASPLPL